MELDLPDMTGVVPKHRGWRLHQPNWIPTSVVDRIRLLFLAFAVANIFGVLPILIWVSPEVPALRAAGGIAGLLLIGVWARGYRQRRFSLIIVAIECAGLLVLVAAVGLPPEQSLGVLFACANFRAMFGSKRDLATIVLAIIVAFLAGHLIGDAPRFLDRLGSTGVQVLGVPMSAVMMYVLAKMLARHERSAARERALAGAGADLMAATTREEAIKAILEAVLAMLSNAGVIVRRASLAARSGPDEMTVLAARGDDAMSVQGVHIDLTKIPPRFRVASLAQLHLNVDPGVAQAMAMFLGFPPHLGVITVTPLSVNAVSTGLLIVESAAELPAECGDGLLTLSAEAALALGAVQLTHDLRRDIEQRQALEAQLIHQAFHDALTGLPNRILFGERTQRALDRACESSHSVAVLFVDLDGFKTINDSLGHAVGDQLLVELSNRLQALSMNGTLVARLGGDEFAILIEDIVDPAAPTRLAEQTLKLLREPTWLTDREVIVEASIGIATSTSKTRRADEMLRDADMAMYTAKHAGKGRSAVYQENIHGALLARLDRS